MFKYPDLSGCFSAQTNPASVNLPKQMKFLFMFCENQCKNNLKLIHNLVSLHYAESALVRKEKYLVIAALSV